MQVGRSMHGLVVQELVFSPVLHFTEVFKETLESAIGFPCRVLNLIFITCIQSGVQICHTLLQNYSDNTAVRVHSAVSLDIEIPHRKEGHTYSVVT